MGVLKSKYLEQLFLGLVLIFGRRHNISVLVSESGVVGRSVHPHSKVECPADEQVGIMHILFRVENDIASVRLDILVPFHSTVVNLSVDTGVTVVKTSQCLEECRTSTTWSTDDKHHLSGFDDT